MNQPYSSTRRVSRTMSKFICNNPTDGGMCHLDAEHYGPCIPSQPASASSTPEPKQFLQDAAGLCQSEANKWEHHDLKTFQHWEKVAMLLRAEFLVQSAKPVAPQPAPSSPTKQVPERTISDECRWCAEGEPEWSPDAKCWIHRRPNLDKRCLRKRLSPVGERADAEDAAESIQVGGSVAPSSPSPQRAKCDGCGADYDPKFAETTCIVCDGIIQPTVAQPTPVESTGLEEQAREIVADVFPSMDRECALRYTKLIAERLAHISQEKDARITQLEKGAEGLVKYARHLDDCDALTFGAWKGKGVALCYGPCTCGRDAALLEYQKIKQGR